MRAAIVDNNGQFSACDFDIVREAFRKSVAELNPVEQDWPLLAHAKAAAMSVKAEVSASNVRQ
ncbi:hypothetical protein EB232_10735 [Mesorhizobium sp. NZP2077]|nr:hypothetical protein EB232_10735 [Mesorhizobium sp. NZP2077]